MNTSKKEGQGRQVEARGALPTSFVGANLLSPPDAHLWVPSPRTAWKQSSGCFVFWILHRITVSRLYSTLHTHSGSHRLWSVLCSDDFLARCITVFEGATMQHPVYELPRIPLPRTPVNKGSRRLLSRPARPTSSCSQSGRGLHAKDVDRDAPVAIVGHHLRCRGLPDVVS